MAVTDSGVIVVTYLTIDDLRLRYKVSRDGGVSWSNSEFVHTASGAANGMNFLDPGPIVASGEDVYIVYWVKTGGTNVGDTYLRKISNP